MRDDIVRRMSIDYERNRGKEYDVNCLVDKPYLCTDAFMRDGNIHIYVVLFCRSHCNNINMQVSKSHTYVP
jgi:hypothetical protein